MVHKETGHKISVLLSKWEWRFLSGWDERGEIFVVENRGEGAVRDRTWSAKKVQMRGHCYGKKIDGIDFRFSGVEGMGTDAVT
jgi:hypothetical protein